MDRKVFICASSHDFVVGGVSTYYMRMFDWAHSRGYRCILLLRSDSRIDEKMENSIYKKNIQVERYKLLSSKFDDNSSAWVQSKDIFIVTADIHCYFRMLKIKEKENLESVRVIFYVLHPQSTRIYENKLLNFPYKRWILSQLKSGVIFMDKETTVSCENYYQIDLKPYEYYRLGEIIPEKDKDVIQKRATERKEHFVILTVARFEFPFKGYVLGLLDDFCKLALDYPNITIKMIGDGEGKKKVQNKIATFPHDIRKRIICDGAISYEELKCELCKAHVFVGMGTTLLDAGGFALPCIVATAFQNGNQTVGLFDKEYDNLGGNIELSKNTSTFEEELKYVINLSDEKYICLEERTYDTVNGFYNINEIMPKILSQKGNCNNSKIGFFLNMYDYFIIILKKFYHAVRGKGN